MVATAGYKGWLATVSNRRVVRASADTHGWRALAASWPDPMGTGALLMLAPGWSPLRGCSRARRPPGWCHGVLRRAQHIRASTARSVLGAKATVLPPWRYLAGRSERCRPGAGRGTGYGRTVQAGSGPGRVTTGPRWRRPLGGRASAIRFVECCCATPAGGGRTSSYLGRLRPARVPGGVDGRFFGGRVRHLGACRVYLSRDSTRCRLADGGGLGWDWRGG